MLCAAQSGPEIDMLHACKTMLHACKTTHSMQKPLRRASESAKQSCSFTATLSLFSETGWWQSPKNQVINFKKSHCYINFSSPLALFNALAEAHELQQCLDKTHCLNSSPRQTSDAPFLNLFPTTLHLYSIPLRMIPISH